jgi:hypothetical protein
MNVAQAVHHPLFQSLVLPLLLSLAGIGVLRAFSNPGRAAAAVGVSVLVSLVWMVGWPIRPSSVMQKLPWIVAGACLAGIALSVAAVGRLLQWLGLTILWCLASWWLGSKGMPAAAGAALAGAAVLACLLQPAEDRADAVSGAAIASLGLAGLCFAAGSLALFQMALLLAAALGGAGLWLWPRPRIRFSVAATAVAGITWLAIAQAALLLMPLSPLALALAAGAFAMAPMFARLRPASGAVVAPLAVAVLGGALVAGALALQAGTADVGDAGKTPSGADDAYYGKQ